MKDFLGQPLEKGDKVAYGVASSQVLNRGFITQIENIDGKFYAFLKPDNKKSVSPRQFLPHEVIKINKLLGE
jgi:DNA polymerase II small subunit/DNA polymerase delta subunit B